MSKKIVYLLIIIPLFIAGCSSGTGSTKNSESSSVGVDNKFLANEEKDTDNFIGEKGTEMKALGSTIIIDEALVDNNDIHYFNYFSKTKNKTIYFFVIKASDCTYRVAANACEVCYGAKKGFTQVGDLIKCNNCGVTYSKDRIALDKGGCNPGPISSNGKVENEKLIIEVSQVEGVANLF
ncbi:MAG TPA: Fe-S-containing protein [Patescibacteria group bacterium]|nr:Fe-S-containing protein [Patescibacteria group bacterium]